MASNSLDLDPSAIPEQIIQESFVQQKEFRSNKPLTLKMQVVQLSTLGWNKSKIAREMKLAPNTVNAILKEANVEGLIASGKFGVSTLIPDSVESIAHHVGKKNLKAAMYVLDKLVFAEESGGRTFSANVQVNVAIPRAKVLVNNMPIEAKSLPETAEKPSK